MPRLTLILSVSVSSERFMYKCTVLHWGFILIWFTSSTASLSAVPSKLPHGAIWVDISQPLSLCSRMLMLLLPTTRTSDLFLDVVNVSGVSGKGFLAPGNGKGNWKSHSRFTGREREFANCYGKGREGKFEACIPGNHGKREFPRTPVRTLVGACTESARRPFGMTET